jgi:hypothetical protein
MVILIYDSGFSLLPPQNIHQTIAVTYVYIMFVNVHGSVMLAVWSKALTGFDCLSISIVGSNFTRGMEVYLRLFCVCVFYAN